MLQFIRVLHDNEVSLLFIFVGFLLDFFLLWLIPIIAVNTSLPILLLFLFLWRLLFQDLVVINV